MKNPTFLNKPKLSEHSVDESRNQIKKELVPKISDFISSHKLFKDKEVEITFAQAGQTSLVSIINAEENKYVLKITLLPKPIEGEGAFLKTWEEDGVSVPHIVEEGYVGDRPYTLMKYVDAPILGQTYSLEEMLSRNIFHSLGSLLAKMHTRNVDGYGPVHNGKPDYKTFSEWFPMHISKRLKYTQEHRLLNDSDHGSIDQAIEIIKQQAAHDKRSTYCHNDFSAYNVFATEPLTIFDPTPAFNHPILDLGLAIIIAVSHYNSEEAAEQMIKGYFGEKDFDRSVLHAAIIVSSHGRIPRWHTTNRPERIAVIQEYLKKNRDLLNPKA